MGKTFLIHCLIVGCTVSVSDINWILKNWKKKFTDKITSLKLQDYDTKSYNLQTKSKSGSGLSRGPPASATKQRNRE